MRRALLAAVLVAVPVAAQANVGQPARTPSATTAATDPAALAAARELMKVTDIQGQMRALAPRMADAVGAQMRQMFTDKMPDGLQSQIAAAMQQFIGSMDTMFTPQLIDQMAAIYARHFSATELTRLTALMRDPAMVHFRQEMPNTMAEMMPVMMAAMQPQQQAFQARIRQIVADWIKQHPEDKAKLRSPSAS